MKSNFPRVLASGLFVLGTVLACYINSQVLPTPTSSPVITATQPAITLPVALSPTATLTDTPPASATPSLTPSPTLVPPQTTSASGNATISTSALCWLGPGNKYEVSSSIPAGTRVTLLGTAEITGWWIIRNPRYHDTCWIPIGYLQVDLGVNVSALPVFAVPPTPTPTP